MTDALRMWTIYDHPSDYPHGFIARQFLVHAGGAEPTQSTIEGSLEMIRQTLMVDMGLVCFRRNEEDDPVIVETWL